FLPNQHLRSSYTTAAMMSALQFEEAERAAQIAIWGRTLLTKKAKTPAPIADSFSPISGSPQKPQNQETGPSGEEIRKERGDNIIPPAVTNNDDIQPIQQSMNNGAPHASDYLQWWVAPDREFDRDVSGTDDGGIIDDEITNFRIRGAPITPGLRSASPTKVIGMMAKKIGEAATITKGSGGAKGKDRDYLRRKSEWENAEVQRRKMRDAYFRKIDMLMKGGALDSPRRKTLVAPDL
ncbi:hypothetical protein HK102_000735, partial [Quaeritorhiza haematococci]